MVKRILGWVGLWLLASFLWCIPVGIFGSSNLVWGEPNQYGRVAAPGTGVVHLPAGDVDGTVAMIIPGRGNETPTVLLPDDLALTVVAVDGSGTATVTRHVGSSGNAMDNKADSQRRVWKIDVPHDGDYRATARGGFSGVGVDVAIWFGHGPPIPGTSVPIIGLVLGSITTLVIWLVRRRRAAPSPPRRDEALQWRPAPEGNESFLNDHDQFSDDKPGDPDLDGIRALERLAKLHESGALTDAEFDAEKHKLIERG